MRFTFPSLAAPNMRWAVYDGESPAYRWRDNCRLSRFVSSFDTMGDGEIQHSGDVCVSNDWRNLSDFVDSIIPVVTTVPPEVMDSLRNVFVPYRLPTREQVEFIGKLRYDDTKYVYVNFEDCKKSTADSKRHDKRWSHLGSHFDGSLQAFASGLAELESGKYLDPLQSIYRWAKVCEMSDYSNYDVARWFTKANCGNVYAGVEIDDMSSFIFKVQAVGDYLVRREELIRDEQRFQRFAESYAAKRLEVA